MMIGIFLSEAAAVSVIYCTESSIRSEYLPRLCDKQRTSRYPFPVSHSALYFLSLDDHTLTEIEAIVYPEYLKYLSEISRSL